MPVPMTRLQLAETLSEMSNLVELGDSFEGSIEYTMPDVLECPDCLPETMSREPSAECEKCRGSGMATEETPDGTYAMVRATYRVGNSMGQGGMRMIGEMQ